ncbi:MAG: hypothetical protein IPJ41_01730 [Phycisphaerales bacterium]|nr:hypothetical protein [Phycisphaerales bacterium]
MHQARSITSPAAACAAILLAAILPTGCGAHRSARPDDKGVNLGLAQMVGDPEQPEEPVSHAEGDLEALVAQQAAALDAAFNGDPEETPTPAADPDAPDVSLEGLVAPPPADPGPTIAAQDAAPPPPPDPAARVEELSTQLNQALGQELESTSEPFRTAVAMIALAAAQGHDPHEAIAPGTAVAAKLSPAELKSAQGVAQLLGTLLSPGDGTEADRAKVLGQLAAKISQGLGLTLPKAVLCTRVRGFGKYEAFDKTDFLAGRGIRALVYVEVDGFEHRAMDNSRLGGLETEDQWSVELSEALELRHEGDGMLAWRRPAEKVVETSRNKQRDFYLLADVQLPSTLTIGAYQLKVVVKDEVSGSIAEKTIPIGIVADPTLAWQPK